MKYGTPNELRDVMRRAGLTRAGAAALVYVSKHTIDAWLKPSTSKSSNPVPAWAIELLAYKTKQAG